MGSADLDVAAPARERVESRGVELLIWSLSALVFLAVALAIYVLPHESAARGDGSVGIASSAASMCLRSEAPAITPIFWSVAGSTSTS